MFVREHYDVEIAYLEGPASRTISGRIDPDTKTVCWLHCTMKSPEALALGFRSVGEAKRCFSRFDWGVFVSKGVMEAFHRYCPMQHMTVLHNTNESDKILTLSQEPVPADFFPTGEFSMIGVGKIEEVKGFDRLARIHTRLRQEGYPLHTFILGQGSREAELRRYLECEGMTESFTLLGYQTTPYQ